MPPNIILQLTHDHERAYNTPSRLLQVDKFHAPKELSSVFTIRSNFDPKSSYFSQHSEFLRPNVSPANDLKTRFLKHIRKLRALECDYHTFSITITRILLLRQGGTFGDNISKLRFAGTAIRFQMSAQMSK